MICPTVPAPAALNGFLPSQKNELFRILDNSSIPLTQFEWEREDVDRLRNLYLIKLVHKPSGYWFEFPGDLYGTHAWSPGDDQLVIQDPDNSNFDHLRLNLIRWFESLKREIEQPDLWGMVDQETALAEASAEDDNRSFSPAERQFIAEQLREIMRYVTTTHKLSAVQMKFIEARVEYMIESSERLGRKDWYNIVLGAVASWVISNALPATAAQELATMIGTTLKPLFEHGLRLLL